MTTTNVYQGMNEDSKPSSRVLRPPGGGSSNIFGPPEPVQQSPSKPYQRSNLLGGGGGETPPAPVAAAASPTSGNKSADGSQDRLFGDSPAVKESPKPASSAKGQDSATVMDEKPAAPKPEARPMPANNQAQGASPQNPSHPTYFRGSTVIKPQQRGAYNPITGEAYQNTPQPAASARVRQPPGGASSGIF